MFNKKSAIKTRIDDNGNIVLTVGAGRDGNPGVGIKNIDVVDNVLKITTTDDIVKEFTIKIPEPIKGDDAVVDYEKIIKEVLALIEIPEPTPVDPLVVAKTLVDEGLVKDGKPGESVNITDVISEVLKKIVVPQPDKPPSADEVANILLDKIVVPQPDKPPSAEEVASILLDKIVIPQPDKPPSADEVAISLKEQGLVQDGKDSPLSKVLKAVGDIKSILGTKDQLLFEYPLADGFNVITVGTVAKVADGSGNYASETKYFLNCVNGNASKVDEKPVFNTVTTNTTLKSTVQLKGNLLQVFGNGVETSETTWKIDVIIK